MDVENKKTDKAVTTVVDAAVDKARIEANIEEVLERLRPFLQREGGNIEIDHFDDNDGTLYVRRTGACNGCYLATNDVSDSFSVVITEEVPEVKRVELVQPQQDSFEDLLKRLKEEEQAQQELDEYNRTHPKTESK